MAIFVRKNVVEIAAGFVASDGTTTQPSAANCVLNFNDQTGAAHTVTIALTYNSVSGQWTGTWDSSAAGQGTVFWMIWGYGTLQAASEGCFEIEANAANTL